jgi:hypothetical protein
MCEDSAMNNERFGEEQPDSGPSLSESARELQELGAQRMAAIAAESAGRVEIQDVDLDRIRDAGLQVAEESKQELDRFYDRMPAGPGVKNLAKAVVVGGIGGIAIGFAEKYAEIRGLNVPGESFRAEAWTAVVAGYYTGQAKRLLGMFRVSKADGDVEGDGNGE